MSKTNYQLSEGRKDLSFSYQLLFNIYGTQIQSMLTASYFNL